MAKSYKTKTKYSYSSQVDYEMKPGESEEQFYKRVMNAAKKRMQRLEKLSEQKDFENVLNYSYRNARKEIEALWGEGAKYFTGTVPKDKAGNVDVRERNDRLAAAMHFLGSATSTKEGIIQVYTKRAESISKLAGVEINWHQLADIADAMDAGESGGSPSKLKAIGVIKTIEKDGIEKALKKNKNMKDEVLMKLVGDYLTSGNSKSLRDILNISEDKAEDMFYQIKAKEFEAQGEGDYENIYNGLKSGAIKIEKGKIKK